MVNAWSRLSMPQGPAMMASPGPPMLALELGNLITVLSGLVSRLTILYGLVTRMTSCTPGISSGDADGGALRPRHGVGAVPKRFDFLANSADLLFRGLRLHDDQHRSTPGPLSLAGGGEPGKWLGVAAVA